MCLHGIFESHVMFFMLNALAAIVKEFRKYVDIWQRYKQKYMVSLFFDSQWIHHNHASMEQCVQDTGTCWRLKFAGNEVIFTDDLRVVDDVELFSGRQLLAADAAGETFEMVDGLTCTPYQIVRWDALSASATLGAETSAAASEYSARPLVFYSTIHIALGMTSRVHATRNVFPRISFIFRYTHHLQSYFEQFFATYTVNISNGDVLQAIQKQLCYSRQQ